MADPFSSLSGPHTPLGDTSPEELSPCPSTGNEKRKRHYKQKKKQIQLAEEDMVVSEEEGPLTTATSLTGTDTATSGSKEMVEGDGVRRAKRKKDKVVKSSSRASTSKYRGE